ncbi:MAG: gamma-glutamyl-gamma-aminobutyrate hydrolase family protein [Nitrospiraceae bacterium]|nr:gamma-glutamyl-gamma-aminobutyrate hydrolase family protein [Nitrospiraceae bacterium]
MGAKLPVIGITADYEPQHNENHPRHFLKAPYVDTLRDAGALVVILPFQFFQQDQTSDVSQWDFLDGILISGSGPDIPPSFYGKSKEIQNNEWMTDERVRFEQALIKKSEDDKTPCLGICSGLQALNVYRGGTLLQDIPSRKDSFLDHKSPHAVHVEKRPPIDWIPEGDYQVNSFHHQGVDLLGSGLSVFAKTSDGMVEGVIDPSHPFMIAVQWHPERFLSGDHLSRLIISQFVESCAARKSLKESRSR